MKFKILSFFLLCSVLVGCTSGFEELQVNPNSPTEVQPTLLFTGLTRSTFSMPSENAGQMAAQFYVHYQGGLLDEVTYYFQRSSFGNYNAIMQAGKMVEMARKNKAPAYFEGLAKLFRSIHYVTMTERMGDIPYSQSLKGEEGVERPAYDTQKQVYLGVLQELEEANALIPATGSIAGDILYGGSLLKWKKLVNTYRLKVLMSLSYKADDPDLQVKEQFRKIVEDPTTYPIMTSMADNAAFQYYDLPGQQFVYYSRSGLNPFRMTNTLGKVLKDNQDPRLFRFFDVPRQPANLNPADFNAYKGMPHGLPTTQSTALEATTSALHNRYWQKAVVEPYLSHAYHELQFILAEAAFREWISGDAETYYNEGIRASCRFFNVPEADITAFLSGPAAYNEAEGLRQISIQRWVGYFHNSGYDALWNHRRTRLPGFDPSGLNTDKGYPEFEVGPANRNEGRLPFRFSYPIAELDNNTENVTEAIRRQFGNDDANHKMWILQR
ncbi:MAG: SusD/RagB family nutrient-binding outer membrane lipoprotein [Adhaeribacter sp.]